MMILRNPGESAHSGRRRRAVAAVWALVVLTVLSVVVTTVTMEVIANRRVLDRRQSQIQNVWLARAGIELAAERLLANAADYKGESREIIPDSQVSFEIAAVRGAPNTFLVSSEARSPLSATLPQKYSVTRTFRRTADKQGVRLVAVEPAAGPEASDRAPTAPTKK
jgi:hypothetical protein